MSKFKNAVVVIDLRKEDIVQAGHIEGSTAIGIDALTAMKDAFPAKKAAPIVVVADDDVSALKAFATIRGWGFKNASVLQGGFAGWHKAGYAVATGKTAAEIVYVPKPIPGAMDMVNFKDILAKKSDDTVIIDVRTEEEVTTGSITGSLNIPTEEIAERVNEIPKGKMVVAYCSTGIRAEMAYLALKDKGVDAKFVNAKIDFAEGKYTISEN